MVAKSEIYSELLTLPESRQAEVLRRAREQAYSSEGRSKVRLKLASAQILFLVVCSFVVGFCLAAAYYVVDASPPSSQVILLFGALTGVAIVGTWRSIEKRAHVCLLAGYISSQISGQKI